MKCGHFILSLDLFKINCPFLIYFQPLTKFKFPIHQHFFMPLIDKESPLHGDRQYLLELNDLWSRSYENDGKATQIRKLLERMFKQALEIPPKEYVALSGLFQTYKIEFTAWGFENTAKKIIKELNKWSHASEEELDDEGCRSLFERTNTLLEKICRISNKNRPWEPAPSLSFLDYDEALNPRQREAVASDSEISLVDAGPGTGKTQLVAARMISAHKRALEADSNKKVAGISYTNQAANELRLRLEGQMGGEWVREGSPYITSTIHSFCLQMLRDHGGHGTELVIAEEEEAKKLKKRMGAEAFEEYMKRNNLITFDGILRLMLETLNDDPSFCHFLQQNLLEVVIDEAQDLSIHQYNVFALLHDKCQVRLFFVGDQRQNIYKFNGGSIGNLSKSFPDTPVARYVLEESYRCPGDVLNFVNRLQFSDCENEGLRNPAHQQKRGKLNLFSFDHKSDEAIHIASVVQELLKQPEVSPKDIAILAARGTYFDSISVELNQREVSWEMFGGQQELPPVISAYCKVIMALSDENTHLLGKVVSAFKLVPEESRQTFHDQLKVYAQKAEDSNKRGLGKVLRFIEANGLQMAVEFSELTKNLYTVFEEMYQEHDQSVEKLRELEDFVLTLEKSGIDSSSALASYVTSSNQSFKKYFQVGGYKCTNYNAMASVTLSTIHSAKGREWPYVFVAGLMEGHIPHYLSNDPNDDVKKLYVACTRSSQELNLSYPRIDSNRGQHYTASPSRFLSGMPFEHKIVGR